MDRLRVGDILEGRYRIEAMLASGGQANVYRGTHTVLERPVAIKHLKGAGHPEVMERMTRRFEQEARLISALRDPHTITLYDFGRVEDGSLFMIFEYIDGQSLKELLESQGRVAPHRVAKILRQTLSSLQEAHSFGVLHRDIKPANIMLYEHAGRPDQAKLLDFGIAKILRDSDAFAHESLTGVNSVVGTPRYIPPESYQEGAQLTPASDIYSLGLVAYELLFNTPAIRGATPVDVFRAHLTLEDIELPRSVFITPRLRALIEKMLRKEPTHRFASAQEMLWELEQWPRALFEAPAHAAVPQLSEESEPLHTDALSAQELAELALPHVDVMPLSASDLEPLPVLVVEPLHDSEAYEEPDITAHTPNPDVESTADRLARELGIELSSRRSLQLKRSPQEHDTRPALMTLETLIAEQHPTQLDPVEEAPWESSERGGEDDGEDDGDDTMNVDVKKEVEQDTKLARALGELDLFEPEPSPHTLTTPAPQDYATPDDKTQMLTELPSLGKTAVLRRRRRRRTPPKDDRDE